MYTELCKIIEYGRQGDTERVVAYARLLAENLDKAGQSREAQRVRRALGEAPPGKEVVIPTVYFPENGRG